MNRVKAVKWLGILACMAGVSSIENPAYAEPARFHTATGWALESRQEPVEDAISFCIHLDGNEDGKGIGRVRRLRSLEEQIKESYTQKGFSDEECVRTGTTHGITQHGTPACSTEMRYLCEKGGVQNPQDYETGVLRTVTAPPYNTGPEIVKTCKGPVTGYVTLRLSGGWCDGGIGMGAENDAQRAAQKRYRDIGFKDEECRFTGSQLTESRYAYCVAEATYYCEKDVPTDQRCPGR